MPLRWDAPKFLIQIQPFGLPVLTVGKLVHSASNRALPVLELTVNRIAPLGIGHQLFPEIIGIIIGVGP